MTRINITHEQEREYGSWHERVRQKVGEWILARVPASDMHNSHESSADASSVATLQELAQCGAPTIDALAEVAHSASDMGDKVAAIEYINEQVYYLAEPRMY